MRRPLPVILVLVCMMGTTGCRTWQPVDVSSPALSNGAPDVVRIVRTDGTRATLEDPRIVADSIVGFAGFDPVRTALVDVESVELQRWSGPRTVGLIVAQASVVLHFVALIVHVQPHYRGLF
jgi:hypothetical protein